MLRARQGYPGLEIKGRRVCDDPDVYHSRKHLLIFGLGIVLATIGFVIYGCVKGWKNVMPDYDKKKG